MDISIHHSTTSLQTTLPIPYFDRSYLDIQGHGKLIIVESDDFFIPFNVIENKAISIAGSPFGSIYKKSGSATSLLEFEQLMVAELEKAGLDTLQIIHPSSIYSDFVSYDQLKTINYATLFEDINQHIVLDNHWESSIHKMQQRKLQALRDEGFEFREMPKEDFKTAHQFLSVCRQAQGLTINITWEQLDQLTTHLPKAYQCFGVFRDGKISALCISVNVSKETAYYYLPATSPMFRNQSPMVLLIAGMVNYYRSKGFKYLDLGVSSYQGKPQETLKLFKSRMGAIESIKPTFVKAI